MFSIDSVLPNPYFARSNQPQAIPHYMTSLAFEHKIERLFMYALQATMLSA